MSPLVLVDAPKPGAVGPGRSIVSGRPPTPSVALADRLRTRHLIKDLLDNALRHGLSPVRVGIGATKGMVVCSFLDAGGGVDRAIEAQLFREYEPESAHTRAGGTGPGLRVARILARSMGGDLLSAGGFFVLSLPLGSTDR